MDKAISAAVDSMFAGIDLEVAVEGALTRWKQGKTTAEQALLHIEDALYEYKEMDEKVMQQLAESDMEQIPVSGSASKYN